MVREKFGGCSGQTSKQISVIFFFSQPIQMKKVQSVKVQGDFHVMHTMIPMNITRYFCSVDF